MLKTLLSLIGRDLLYITNILIVSQIYICNLKDLIKNSLLNIANLLINCQIYTQNLIQV